jgi:hypothetical protein
LEDSITVDELFRLHRAVYKTEHRHNRFLASVNGIDLDEFDEEEEEDPFERIKRKVEAELAGKSEEEYALQMMGIEVETDDDEDLPPAAPEVEKVEINHPNYFDMILEIETDD